MNNEKFMKDFSIKSFNDAIYEIMKDTDHMKDDINWIGVSTTTSEITYNSDMIEVSVEDFFNAAKKSSTDTEFGRHFVIMFKDGSYIYSKNEYDYDYDEIIVCYSFAPKRPTKKGTIKSLTNSNVGLWLKSNSEYKPDDIHEIEKQFDIH